MGCPAKKVCNKWAGSALMQNEALARADRRGGGRGLCAAWRAGDAENAHRLVRSSTKTPAAGAPASSAAGIADADRAWPHARAGLQGRSRVRDRGRGQGRRWASRWWPMATSPARKRRAAVLAATGADAADGGPRGAGPALDFPRDRALSWPRASIWRRPWWHEVRRLLLEHLQDHYSLYGEPPACAARASTSRGMLRGAAGRRQPCRPPHQQREDSAGCSAESVVRWVFRIALEQADEPLAPHGYADALQTHWRTGGITCIRSSNAKGLVQDELEACVRDSLQRLLRRPGRRNARRHVRHAAARWWKSRCWKW